MPKKKRKGSTDSKQNGGERRENDHLNSAGPSSAQNAMNIEPNPDVNKIPLNKNGTFIEKILVGCSFCSQRFDRPDYYYLHHAEKHAKLYGHLPNPVSDQVKDTDGNKDGPSTERKRRCSVYINKEKEDSYSSDTSELSKDDKTNDPNINNEPDKKLTKDSSNVKTQRKRKLKSSKMKPQNDSSNSDDSDIDIRKIIQSFERKLQSYKRKMKKSLRCKRSLVYKCKKCSLHFLDEYEWRKHVSHVPNPSKCKYCMLNFSYSSLKRHENMHMKGGQIQKILKYFVVTHKSYDYTSSESDNDMSGKSSESNDEEYKADHSKTVTELVTNENELNTNQDDITVLNNQNDVKKKYKARLFKCDDCEEHFLTRKNLDIHTKNSTHYYRSEKKNTQCNVCTITFSSAVTLLRHRRLHHNNRLNLSKDDFLITTSTKFNTKLPKGVKLRTSKNKMTKNIKVNKLTPNPNTANASSICNQDNINMYKCEGCNLHFMNRSTWNHHLNQPGCCKNKFNSKECPYCRVFFTNKIWNGHMERHKVSNSNFKIHSRKPKWLKTVTMPQSDVVSTTENDLDSNVSNNAPHGDQDFSSNQNQNTSKNTSNAESCKVKLAKSTAGPNKWQVVSNRPEDVLNTSTTEPSNAKDTTIDNASKNETQNSELAHNEESYLNTSTTEPSNAKNITIDNASKNDTQNPELAHNEKSYHTISMSNDSKGLKAASNANLNSLRIDDKTASLPNVRNQSFAENIMVEIPSTGNSNKKAQPESGDLIITTADTTMEVCNTPTSNQENNQNETQDERTSINARIKSVTFDQGLKNKMIESEKHSDNSDNEPPVKEELSEEERNDAIVNVSNENIGTDSNDNDQALSQIKNETSKNEIDIKLEHDFAENGTAVPYKETEAVVTNSQDVVSENNEDETRKFVSKETDDVESDNNEFGRIRITNSYSLGLKFEELSSSCFFNAENNMENVDSTENLHRNTTHEVVEEYDPVEPSFRREVDKIPQREVENMDSDDSQATVVLECYNEVKYEPTFDCNDATINTNLRDRNEINIMKQNVTDKILNEPGNEVSLSENCISVPTNDTTQEIVASNENPANVTIRQEVQSTSVSVDGGSSGFRVRDRSETNHNDDDFVVVFDSTRIKNEEAEEIRARNRQSNRKTRHGDDIQHEIINLTNDGDENGDIIMERQIVATIDISDDDD